MIHTLGLIDEAFKIIIINTFKKIDFKGIKSLKTKINKNIISKITNVKYALNSKMNTLEEVS